MVASWLWEHLLLATGLIVLVILVLVAGLTRGWNSPRPRGRPDWEAQILPRRLDVAPNCPSVALFDQRGSDFAFEGLIQPTKLPKSALVDYGLIYRAQDIDNHYAFLIGADGYYAVMKVEGGRRTALVPWQQFPHIRQGLERNRLLVSCAGPVCTFRINDEYAVTVEDDRWVSGNLGIGAESPEGEAAFTFLWAQLWLRDD